MSYLLAQLAVVVLHLVQLEQQVVALLMIKRKRKKRERVYTRQKLCYKEKVFFSPPTTNVAVALCAAGAMRAVLAVHVLCVKIIMMGELLL